MPASPLPGAAPGAASGASGGPLRRQGPAWRPASGTIPAEPGVYKFRDEHGRVIYVGKARSLRSRLNTYFTGELHPRTAQMVRTARSVEWTVVGTEVEALQLEYSWIKQFDPHFNVRYRDDKSYPWLAVTVGEDFPRLQVMRGAKRKGVRYFGPYSHAWAIRETLDLLLRVFPVRTCKPGVFRRAQQTGRPCLLGYIDKCSAPCVGRVDPDEHRRIVDEFCDFMAGSTGPYLRRVEAQMREAAAAQEYERAARLRDDLGALTRALEKQAVVLADSTDADVIGIAEDDLEAGLYLFHVRAGRVRGERWFVMDKVEQIDAAGVIGQFVELFYGGSGSGDGTEGAGDGAADVPREVLVSAEPADADALSEWLCALRGTKVAIRAPHRGDKRALLDTVERNAGKRFAEHKVRRGADLTARSVALQEIQDALELPEAPLRIECYDVSNLQGTEVVASMVVFEDGLARKSEYRRFAVRGPIVDDTASLEQVLTRRFARYLAEQARGDQLEELTGAAEPAGPIGPIDPSTGRPRRFAYPPNLVVVDGGPPQVAAAARALAALGIEDVALCGLAKRLEEVWLPHDDAPVILPRTSEGLYLLQRVRDEAHRFAITYHRQKRSKSMVASALDGVPGLGEARRTALLRHFGSVAKVRRAGVEEIAALPGFGPRTAAAVVAALAGGTGAAPPVDPATGEILG